VRVEDAFAVIDAGAGRFGRLDVLCNVAGLTDRGTVDDTTPELWDRLVAVNARAPFFMTQRAVPHMRRAGGGSVVNVISIAAHGGAPHITPYVASKSALIGLTRNLANALRGDRIRVNGLNMGWTATPGEEQVQRREHGMGDDWKEAIGATRPFGRLLDPDEVAHVVVFLGGPESGLVSGAVWDYEQTAVGASD
jgi:NAD(P)-dependent dehydrogenase (short-subunit alcohol dehydrogenase family)